MPQFRYRAVSAAAQTVEGMMEAPDRPALIDRLHATGHVPLRVVEVRRTEFGARFTAFLRPPRRMTARSLALIASQLATLLRAGLALDEALGILEELVEDRFEKACLRGLIDRISAGSTVAEAMAAQRNVFPDYAISVVHAGESSANLDAALERLADFVERSRATRAYVTSALIYPAIVASACVISIVILLLYVVPRFRPLFQQAKGSLPLSAQYLMALSDAVRAYWWLEIVLLGVGGAATYWYLREPGHRIAWRRRSLRLPLVGELIRKIDVSQFARTLGTLLQNGVPLLTALAITRDTMRHSILGEAIDALIERAKAGKGLAQPMRQTGSFPALAVHLVRIGEESGRQDEMLVKTADIFESETRRTLDRLLALIAPAVTIVLGVIVAGVFMTMLSALLTVYDLTM